MGKSKKKEKKKRKRQRSSSRSEQSGSESDSYDDRRSSSHKADGSTRPKQLQALADNYGSKSYPEQPKSRYDMDNDIPETEEYIYDQFGQQIVDKRAVSPGANIEEFGGYGGRKSSSEKKSIPVNRIRQEAVPPRGQVATSAPYREFINLVDDATDSLKTKQKETIYIGDDDSRPPGVDDDELNSNADGYYKDQKEYSSHYPADKYNGQSKSSSVDCNSAEFMISKIRQESNSKSSDHPSFDSSTRGRHTSKDNSPFKQSDAMYEDGELPDHPNTSTHRISRDKDKIPNSRKEKTGKYDELAPPGDDDFSDVVDNYGSKSSRYNDDKRNDARKHDRRRESPPKRDTKDDSATVSTASSNQESISIEETNKIREKLGLKPLNVGSGSSEKPEEKAYADRADVHRPAGNIAEKKSADKMREKMEAIREKRKINKKLKKVKGLGEEDDPVLDSAAAWVAKSRIMEAEKKLAEKRAKELDAMDEEFGVSKIMARSILKKNQGNDYTSKNLQGLKVEHKGTNMQEGESVVLTLKDKDILDEDDEDVLLNVNIREDEKAKENLRNKKKRPGYQAYDEVDEETGELKIRTVLDKYDEEIDGKKTVSFRLGSEGTADLDGENQMEKVRAILKSQQVSLAAAEPQLARDYLTTEEMTKFKTTKKKKVRKIRKREVLKADDLLKMSDVDTSKDRGSRKGKNAREEEDTSMDMDIAPTEPDELDYFVAVNQHTQDAEPLTVDDIEVEQELEIALQRSRRVKLKTEVQLGDSEDSRIEKVAKQVLSKQEVKEEAESVRNKLKKKNKTSIVLDSTSEFCRTLGDLPTLTKPVEKEEEKADDDMDIEEPTASGSLAVSSWEKVEMAQESKPDEEDDDDDDVLEAEPIPTGLAATLNLANMKGYLKDGKEKVRKFDPLNLPETKAEVDVEKLRDEEKNKYSRGGGGYDRGDRGERYDPYTWKEKQNYKPDVKLEYVDNKGRQMNQKEAFRLLSHKFHGKGSGKLKTEKRSKKLEDQKKLQMMSSIDTPLNTSALFKDKQQKSQSAYLVLSGGGKNILSGESLKK